MLTVPMLADFAVRVAFGLVAALALTSWRAVPLRFFRIQTQIAMAVLVLAAMAQASTTGGSAALWLLIAAAVAAYLATVTWGLGLPSVATIMDGLVVASTGAWMIVASRVADPGLWVQMTAGRAVSGLLLGTTLHSMLLGHYYLIAPAMSIAPLTRALDLIVAALVASCLLAAVGATIVRADPAASVAAGRDGDLAMLAMRWGMGVVGAGVSVVLARRTAAIRSTQSATGILYITTIFVLFGELAAMVMAARERIG
jgi:hypothetical protein